MFACAVETNSKIIPKHVSLQCDDHGYPKTEALKYLVAMLYLNKIDENSIVVEQTSGGLYSKRMYVISIKKNGSQTPLFFFKISSKAGSTQNLLKIQHGFIGQKCQELNNTHGCNIAYKNFPMVMLLAYIFTYNDQDGTKKTIEVTAAAPGQLLQDILNSGNTQLIKKASLATGKALGCFHQSFINYKDSDNPSDWITVYHGDFSIKNTLFNPANNKVYFIDNEGMNTGHIDQDLFTMVTSLVMFQYLRKNYTLHWPLYKQHCLSFLKGYIESYPSEKHAALAVFIENMLNASLKKVLYKRSINDKIIDDKDFNEQDFKKTIYTYLRSVT